MSANSNRSERGVKRAYKKPRPDFPLGIHKATGYWCKKVRGRVHYFGKVADDPKGKAALEEWLRVKDDLLAGRTPPDTAKQVEGMTVEQLCNLFLAHKELLRDGGELSPRTYLGYFGTCEGVIRAFGKQRLVADLQPDDFRQLKLRLAKTRKLVALGNAIVRVRTIFRWGFEEGHIPNLPRYGQAFKKPDQDKIDIEKEKNRRVNGAPIFEPEEFRLMLEALDGNKAFTVTDKKGNKKQVVSKSNCQLQAMILLAANCAFGQSDLSGITLRCVDLDKGWIDYGRGKTGAPRRIPLWPETVAAIRDYLPHRPTPKLPADKNLLFLTCRGAAWVRLGKDGHHIDGIGQEFDKLQTLVGIKRPRRGIYAFRHTFETEGGDTADQVAVNAVMGHRDRSMAAGYRHRIKDQRLQAVVDRVREYYFDSCDPCDPSDPEQKEPAKTGVKPRAAGSQKKKQGRKLPTRDDSETSERVARDARDAKSTENNPPTLRIFRAS